MSQITKRRLKLTAKQELTLYGIGINHTEHDPYKYYLLYETKDQTGLLKIELTETELQRIIKHTIK